MSHLLVTVVFAGVVGQGQPVDCVTLSRTLLVDQLVELRVADAAVVAAEPTDEFFVWIRHVQEDETVARAIASSRSATFVFVRGGTYRLQLARRKGNGGWPGNSVGTPEPGCREQTVTVNTASPGAFSGVRGHVWLGNQLWFKPAVGASLFVEKIGAAVTIGPDRSRAGVGGWAVTLEGRYRGSRGYFGGGARYFTRRDGEAPQVRPQIVMGQELPTFKGRPVWFTLDLSLDSPPRWNMRRSRYSLNFGVRLDLTSERP